MMSSVLGSRSVSHASPIKITEEASRINIEKQGIMAILGKDLEVPNVSPTLRRTLSADMSSKNFLSQNGSFSPMKRIASSEDLAASITEGDEDLNNMPGHEDIWRSIQQSQMEKKEEVTNPTPGTSVWSSILSEKAINEANNLPPPYIHPLVKKPSTLNDKSLEICTESLGSETGSDDYSYPNSETGDAEDDKEAEATQQKNEPPTHHYSFEEVKVAKYNYDPSKKITPKPFPPPLHSLARKDGPSLHMQSHRKNGRLVLEAVSIPQRNYFKAERQEGRLVLTLVNSPSHDSTQEAMGDEVANFEEVFGNLEDIEDAREADTDEEDYVEENEEDDDEVEMEVDQEGVKQNAMNDIKFFMEQSSSSLPTIGMLNVHRSALMMKSLMGLGNKDPTWSNKLNKAVELMEEQVVAELAPPPIPQSLPPQPHVARLIPTPSTPPPAISVNAYEYFWRNKKAATVNHEYSSLKGNNNKVVLAKINDGFQANEQEENMVLVKGKNGDYLVPFIQGCKESRRSLLSRQPHCIATS